MNLERISIKVVDRESVFLTLAKISDFRKLYTTFILGQDLSMQKINTGDSILALNFKNIEQFKAFRPFKPFSQDELLELYKVYGTSFLYQTKLHFGDLVRYNGLKYVVLGIVVNTYAQWNMPTPLLFNPANLNNDYKSLYGSRLTEEQINSKINDNFQAGKYDADMVIPLVDANDFSDYITILEPRPSKEEVELMFDSVKAEKDLTIKSQKDVFIDTMLRLRGNEINQIKEVNEDLFKGVQTLLLSVNKAVNKQIEMLPEPAVEKPARKPREKKVVEEVIEKVEPVVEIDSDELPNFIGKDLLVKDYPEQVKKLIVFRSKQQDVGDYIFDDSLTIAFDWYKTPEGSDFWSLVQQGNLIEFKGIYGNKGEKVDELIEFEDLTKFVETEILPKAPVVEKQEVLAVEVIFYPPSGGVLELKTYSIVELSALTTEILNILKVKTLKLNFKAIVRGSSHTTQISIKTSESYSEILDNLVKQYDKFVKPELNWSDFSERKPDTDRVSLNSEILQDAFLPKPKPVPVEKPKPVKVVAPKVVAPKIVTSKPVTVVKPKPIKVVAPKVEKVIKPKVTKAKVEDDLSFLDDLDNIF